MKKYFIILLFSLFFFPLISFAYEYDYKLENTPSDLKEQTKIINKYILKIYSKSFSKDPSLEIVQNFIKTDVFFNKHINNINMNVWIYNNNTIHSFSNIHNGCNITINYPDINKKVFLSDKYKDIFMILSHELSHCLLGKKTIQNMSWVVSLSSTEQERIEQKINQLEINNNLSPFVFYHEIFADTLGALILYKEKILNNNDLKEIINVRKGNYNNDINNPYLGFLGVLKIKSILNNKQINIEKISDEELIYLAKLISQGIFIEYIEKVSK